MNCEICDRFDCTRSFHSLCEQTAYDFVTEHEGINKKDVVLALFSLLQYTEQVERNRIREAATVAEDAVDFIEWCIAGCF